MSFVLLTPKLDKRLSKNSCWKLQSRTIADSAATAKGAIQMNFVRIGPGCRGQRLHRTLTSGRIRIVEKGIIGRKMEAHRNQLSQASTTLLFLTQTEYNRMSVLGWPEHYVGKFLFKIRARIADLKKSFSYFSANEASNEY